MKTKVGITVNLIAAAAGIVLSSVAFVSKDVSEGVAWMALAIINGMFVVVGLCDMITEGREKKGGANHGPLEEIGDEEENFHLFYVARDKDGHIFICNNEPKREEHWHVEGGWWALPSDMFPKLKWEDEPRLVRIVKF